MNFLSSLRTAAASIMLAAAMCCATNAFAKQTQNIVAEDPWAGTTNPGATVAAGHHALQSRRRARPSRLSQQPTGRAS